MVPSNISLIVERVPIEYADYSVRPHKYDYSHNNNINEN